MFPNSIKNVKLLKTLGDHNIARIDNLYSTPLLEISQNNFPYLIFIDKLLLSIRFKSYVYKDLKILLKNRILHKIKKSIYNFLIENINNIDDQCNFKEKKYAQQIIKNKYLIKTNNLVRDFENIIN